MEVDRKRGRPAGKNRAPLSLSEKRARNAHYERERRVKCNNAFAEIAEIFGYSPQISNHQLLKTVTDYIKNTPAVETLREMNENLEREIQELEQNFNELPTTSRRVPATSPLLSTSESEDFVKPKNKKSRKMKKKDKSKKTKKSKHVRVRVLPARNWTPSPPLSSPSILESPPSAPPPLPSGPLFVPLLFSPSAPLSPPSAPMSPPPAAPLSPLSVPPSPLFAPQSPLPSPPPPPSPPIPILPLEDPFIPLWRPIPIPELVPYFTPPVSISPPRFEPEDLRMDLNYMDEIDWNLPLYLPAFNAMQQRFVHEL